MRGDRGATESFSTPHRANFDTSLYPEVSASHLGWQKSWWEGCCNLGSEGVWRDDEKMTEMMETGMGARRTKSMSRVAETKLDVRCRWLNLKVGKGRRFRGPLERKRENEGAEAEKSEVLLGVCKEDLITKRSMANRNDIAHLCCKRLGFARCAEEKEGGTQGGKSLGARTTDRTKDRRTFHSFVC